MAAPNQRNLRDTRSYMNGGYSGTIEGGSFTTHRLRVIEVHSAKYVTDVIDGCLIRLVALMEACWVNCNHACCVH